MHPIKERRLLDRRRFLTSTAGGIGAAALATMLREDGAAAAVTRVRTAARRVTAVPRG